MSAYGSSISFQGNLDPDHELIFTDPQTSGGLLVSVRPDSVDMILSKTREMGFEDIAVIGEARAVNGSASVTFVTE
jgi:selenide,water dikinase